MIFLLQQNDYFSRYFCVHFCLFGLTISFSFMQSIQSAVEPIGGGDAIDLPKQIKVPP